MNYTKQMEEKMMAENPITKGETGETTENQIEYMRRKMQKSKKKLCTRCHKRREPEFYKPRARICEICRAVETGIREKRESSLPVLRKKAQTAFNKWIRERDKDLGCISCNGRVQHAGHFIAQGSSGMLRYHKDNVNGQCVSCNNFKHGNLLEYRIGLVGKIGEDRVQWLETSRNKTKKWSREELKEIIERYK